MKSKLGMCRYQFRICSSYTDYITIEGTHNNILEIFTNIAICFVNEVERLRKLQSLCGIELSHILCNCHKFSKSYTENVTFLLCVYR